jgi:hypothetical protein
MGDDGQFRSIGEPLSGGTLAAATKAVKSFVGAWNSPLINA